MFGHVVLATQDLLLTSQHLLQKPYGAVSQRG